MLKRLFLIALFPILFSCEKQADKASDTSAEGAEQVSEQARSSVTVKQQEEVTKKETAWLNPAYLVADFNGDTYPDTAFAITINNKKGIRIRHGKTREEFVIGAGTDFGSGGKDFDWVDNWKLVTDKQTYEATFTDSMEIAGTRPVKLDHTAFYIGAEEVGGATVAWKNGRYIWIHQAD